MIKRFVQTRGWWSAAIFLSVCLEACSLPRQQLAASPAQSNYPVIVHRIDATGSREAGYGGQGIRVGVISTGISNYDNLKHAGILPSGLVVLGSKKKSKRDEGDRLLQVVHQIAPRAKLAFCLGIKPKAPIVGGHYKLEITSCVKKLINNFHANIITWDFNRRTTKFTLSKVAIKLQKIHRKHTDVLFFSSDSNYAGNLYRGKWTPMKWNLDGKPVLAQNFGTTTGSASSPYNVFRINKGFAYLVIRGHVRVVGTTSYCAKLPVRLVLMDRHNHVIANARPSTTNSSDCGRILLRVNAKGSYSGWTVYPKLKRETTYRLALLASSSIKQNNFRVRLQGLAYSPSKNASWGASFDIFLWRYATTGIAGGFEGSAEGSGVYSIVPLNPHTAFHGRYARQLNAAAGPACYLPTKGKNKGLLCFHQPMLSAPNLTMVAWPTNNKEGYYFASFPGGSAAAPVAAGAAALLLSAGVPAQQVPKLFERTAIKQPRQHGWNPFYGYGQIDIDAAARAAQVLPKHGIIRYDPKLPATASAKSALPAENGSGVAQVPKRLMQAAQSGSSMAMWQLGNSFVQIKSYRKRDWSAALVWWQRAARRKYPFAFCSLGNEYAYIKLKYWLWDQVVPRPYRPRLALALLQACTLLGGGTQQSQALMERLRSRLSLGEIAEVQAFAVHLMRNPAKYLPSLNYEYVPSSPQ
ncbi:MAG: S8 family serine peptidase [Terriglobia bacterium]